ncbi:MAG: hypothetical protein ACXAAH_01000 [Promethearchaeota archaeon]|jgi:hypothetical protein
MTMEKKCENCYCYKNFLGAEYCLFDVQTAWWEEQRKKLEFVCDRFLSKNASFEEQCKYLRNQHEKHKILDIWEDPSEEDEISVHLGFSLSEIYRMKKEREKGIVNRNEFISKYPILNPSSSKKWEDEE